MFHFYVLNFLKKGDTIQGGTLFKGGHYLRKYGVYNLRFYQVWYQVIVKATVFGIFEDFKFKISEDSDQNWSCPDSAQLAVSVKYPRNCSLHNTLKTKKSYIP